MTTNQLFVDEKSNKQYAYTRNIEALSINHSCSGKAISITYSKCVFVALFIQHAMRMCRVVLSPVVYPAISYFSTLSHKRHDFRSY